MFSKVRLVAKLLLIKLVFVAGIYVALQFEGLRSRLPAWFPGAKSPIQVERVTVKVPTAIQFRPKDDPIVVHYPQLDMVPEKPKEWIKRHNPFGTTRPSSQPTTKPQKWGRTKAAAAMLKDWAAEKKARMSSSLRSDESPEQTE